MTLFLRNGSETKPNAQRNGKPFFTQPHTCGRCGGAGGSDKWKFTGWTCYECGGNGTKGTDTFPLYTAEQLQKLNDRAAKMAAKKAEKAAAEKAKRDAEVEARRADFLMVHGPLLARAAKFIERDSFIADVVGKAHTYANLSEGQEAALIKACERIEANDARCAAATYLGSIGERITAKVTVLRVASFDTDFGVSHICSMRDEQGNTIVSKGSFRAEKGDTFSIKATVKDHTLYRDERQTVVQRVKVI